MPPFHCMYQVFLSGTPFHTTTAVLVLFSESQTKSHLLWEPWFEDAFFLQEHPPIIIPTPLYVMKTLNVCL